jgi:hypothetical protein
MQLVSAALAGIGIGSFFISRLKDVAAALAW